jgi:NAD(P)H dehydrogenase (quinone)
MTQPRVLVAGASGRLGQIVLEQLLQAGVTSIAATTRTPEKLATFVNQGVDVRAGDFNHPDGLTKAFDGVDRLLLVSTDDLFSGNRVQQHKNAIEAAKRAGVKHVIYTSMPNPEESTAIPFSPDHVATELALRESGMTYTILRVAWYAENTLDLGLISAALKTGKWLTSAGDGKIAYVTRRDVARAAAAVLAAPSEESRIYDITGPLALSAEQLAASLSRVVERSIDVVQLNDETLGRELVAAGVSAQLAPMLVTTDANTRAGHFSEATTAVRDLTGLPPIDFEQFLRENKKLFQQ